MRKNKIKNGGFVLLFSIIISTIILAVSMGVANIALKEVKFGTSARDTNDAFFAADLGVECVLYHDKSGVNKFPIAGPASPISCASITLTPSFSGTPNVSVVYSFTLTGLGSSGAGCAKVSIERTNPSLVTKLTSRGYSSGSNIPSPGLCTPPTSSVERVLELNY